MFDILLYICSLDQDKNVRPNCGTRSNQILGTPTCSRVRNRKARLLISTMEEEDNSEKQLTVNKAGYVIDWEMENTYFKVFFKK